MNGRRAIVGLCMLCALLVSAFAAQSASAVTKGTTAFTCKAGAGDDGKATFSTAHCRPTDSAGGFGHYTIAENTTTKITGNNKDHLGEAQPGFLVSTVFGTTIELEAQITEGEGWMTNAKDPSGEHYTHGEGTITFTKVKPKKPVNCEVKTDNPDKTKGEKEVVHTTPLKATTTGQGDRLKFEPKEGTTFGTFWITGPECAIDATFTVTGSVLGTPNGATTNFTEADTTTQNTLKVNGAKAGISGTLTIEGKHPGIEGDAYKPLSVTTVETP